MEKEFFDVFPSLKLKDQLKEWLEMVTVSRVTCNPAKTRLWVYIHSERWIHKKFIFALEDQIERQCFPGMEMQRDCDREISSVEAVFSVEFPRDLPCQHGTGTEKLQYAGI